MTLVKLIKSMKSVMSATLVVGLLTAAACSGTGVRVTVDNQPLPTAPIQRYTGHTDSPKGVGIYFERCGEGTPVVFVHGLGGNHAVWHQQVPAFAGEFTAITVSQRGFAPSADVGIVQDIDTLIEDLREVMDTLKVERAHLVGQSMGGWTVLGFALRYPQRVHTLVLADTTAGISDAVIAEHYRLTVERARSLANTPPPLARHPALDSAFSIDRPASAYLYQALAAFGAPPAGRIAEALGHTQYPEQLVRHNKVPTLFIVGQRDPIFPVNIVRRAADQMGSSRVRVVEDTGHSPYYEKPEVWNAAVMDSLRAHATAVDSR